MKERMEFSEAKALITADGARRGKTAPMKQQVDEAMGDARVAASGSSWSGARAPTAR